MRGKVGVTDGDYIAAGITPAHAGKSRVCRPDAEAVWDHPRACGEKIHTPPFHQQRMGSPPRMRGKGRTLGRW